MPLTALTFETPGLDANAWSEALLDAGALFVDVSDPAAGTPAERAIYAEPGAGDAASWPRARLVAAFDAHVDPARRLAEAAAALQRPAPAFDVTVVADEDWVRITQAQFGPISIGDRLHVVPTWCEPPSAGIVVTLDPGLAFGTGSHPTTRLCLEWMLEHVGRGASLLDYGCGSGILALAAAKLGAVRVVGTDVDPQAIRASRDNARQNGVDAAFVEPDALGDERFDAVVANILANPLALLAPAIAARVRPRGRLALSGILVAQTDDVVAAYAPWFTLAAWRAADGWVLLAGERRGDHGQDRRRVRRFVA